VPPGRRHEEGLAWRPVGAPNWPRRVWWLNIAGLLDFVGAIGTGMLTRRGALGFFATGGPRAELDALPLSLIPTFAVPPWTMVHVISLLQLRRLAAAAATRSTARAA
jgi:hypothetical protein